MLRSGRSLHRSNSMSDLRAGPVEDAVIQENAQVMAIREDSRYTMLAP